MDAAKLQEIRKAEQQAAQVVQSIDEEVQEQMRSARSKAQKAMDDAKASVRKNAETLSAQYQKQGQSQAATILSSLDGDLAKIDRNADSSEKKAIEFVLSEMKVFHGHR